MAEIHIIPVQNSLANYIFVIRDGETTSVVDPCDAGLTAAFLNERGWGLNYILCTHHHHDHVGGTLDLKAQFGAKVLGGRKDALRIPGIDVELSEGDRFLIGSTQVQVIETFGHTVGHISYYLPDAQALFCGDTLFSLGCGRMFEGNPAQFWESLLKIRALPDDTLVYCTHEYTASNGRFVRILDRNNDELAERLAQVDRLQKANKPSIPSQLGQEKRLNPFLRCDDSIIKRLVGLNDDADPAEVFGQLRRRKDVF